MSSIPIITTAAPNTNWLKTIASLSNATLEFGTNWLSDFLPDLVPNARILAYQYNANIAFGVTVTGVEE